MNAGLEKISDTKYYLPALVLFIYLFILGVVMLRLPGRKMKAFLTFEFDENGENVVSMTRHMGGKSLVMPRIPENADKDN